MGEKENIVKEALAAFLQKNDANDSISSIDEIVLSYMVGILEELGDANGTMDNFDVEDFTEMMTAYLPGFEGIDSVAVCSWMFELSNTLSTEHEKGKQIAIAKQPNKEITPIALSPSPPINSLQNMNLSECHSPKQGMCQGSSQKPIFNGIGSSPKQKFKGQRARQHRKSSSSRSASESSDVAGAEAFEQESPSSIYIDSGEENIRLLLEMFPAASEVKAAHCLSMAKGDIEQAANLMLVAQELEEQDETPPVKSKSHKKSTKKSTLSELDDKKLKKSIIQRYSYQDSDEHQKQHNPVVKIDDPKKLVRYRNGQVVSTKGERFSEIKKGNEEEMKKTYINLKPAKQYRFH
ncbi:unnamed protein product [Owenia fusiformis]|uniref:CUE domain-containing protein 2 n=1 Tax=Owenia fusiformis TaxID=6347 RepID=A0A8S4Q436_OWEFU|nr:unnamed protein product [Owenia fusiformis]